MQDASITTVFESDREIEARMALGWLAEAGVRAQLRTAKGPPPCYRIVVHRHLAIDAARAINERCGEQDACPAMEVMAPASPVLTPGRALIWLLLILLVLAVFFILL